ncbi:hypothetical protein [Vibrio nigripulchritudo]|uniref:hypothetical protein n=1 Tax=Vibrio nigripulchritudo TaxID=28173 RepID=UPI00190D0FBB|nr:hypothetical protein [Vibrio nigripulchritudo]
MDFIAKIKLDDVFTALSAVSALAAAIAAGFSYKVSKDSLKFQKQLATNQTVSVQLNSVLNLVVGIKLVLPNISSASDEEFTNLDEQLVELKRQVAYLSQQAQLPTELIRLASKTGVALITDSEIELTIKAVQKQIEALWK